MPASGAAKELTYTIFDTDIGWVGILKSPEGLLCTTLPQRSSQEAYRRLGKSMNFATYAPYPLADLTERFRAYFSGHQETFPDEIDLSEATCFQRQVWQTTRLIPYGETRSYLWVAKQIKKPRAARAVGQALKRNPLPIIVPCHRVTGSEGKIGGFREGVEIKSYLIRLES